MIHEIEPLMLPDDSREVARVFVEPGGAITIIVETSDIRGVSRFRRNNRSANLKRYFDRLCWRVSAESARRREAAAIEKARELDAKRSL